MNVLMMSQETMNGELPVESGGEMDWGLNYVKDVEMYGIAMGDH